MLGLVGKGAAENEHAASAERMTGIDCAVHALMENLLTSLVDIAVVACSTRET